MANNNSISHFLNSFLKRKGGFILASIVISKVLSFLLTIYIIKKLTVQEFGNISYAYNIISFIIPFMGLGIYQSLGRYGAIAKSQVEKRRIFKFIFSRGSLASLAIILVIILLSGLITSSLPNAQQYLIYLSFLVLSLFILESVKLLYRVYGLNKLFAYIEIAHTTLTLILGVLLSYFYGGMGYVIAIIVSPLLVCIYITIKNKLYEKTPKTNYSTNEKTAFWQYGFYTSLGGLAAKLLFSIDILMIGYLLKSEESVAIYKAATLIPFSLLFIPNGFIKTDIVKITAEYQNKKFLIGYIKNYMKVFTVISLLIFGALWFLAKPIMFYFGESYQHYFELIPVLALGIIGAFVFRNLFGNLLDAIGWAKTSATISLSILLLDTVMNYFLVKSYGIIGAAYSTSILLWLSGITAALAILSYLKKLD